MELTALPYEVQYEFLLDEPYKTILNYCQLNSRAASICQSDSFWKAKLVREGWRPELLDLIDGSTPAVRYQILMYLQNGGTDRMSRAIRLGQFRYLKKIWLPGDENNLQPGAIVDAIVLGHPEIAELLRSLITDPITFDYLMRSAMQSALEDEQVEIALYLRSITNSSHLDLLGFILGIFGEDSPEAVETILGDAKVHGQEKIVQQFAELLVNDHEDTLLRYLLDHHPDELDIRELFILAVEECPIAQQLRRSPEYISERCSGFICRRSFL